MLFLLCKCYIWLKGKGTFEWCTIQRLSFFDKIIRANENIKTLP